MSFDFAQNAALAADEINARFAPKDACGAIAHALTARGKIALVSSFGAEAAVLLHMVAGVDRATPVLFLETGMLFPETLSYQRALTQRLGLTDVRLLRPDPDRLLVEDVDGIRHLADPDGCCAVRKVAPLAEALTGFDGWISGRKRFHGGQRVTLDLAEAEGGQLKLNPLAHWTPADIAGYMETHDLPRHPLVAKGYGSIGCAPCTTRGEAGEAHRAGRWRGVDKAECGIHFSNGQAVRSASL